MAVGAAGLAAFKGKTVGEGIESDDEMLEGDTGFGEGDEGEAEEADYDVEVQDEEGFMDFLDVLMDNAEALDMAASSIDEELVHEEMPSPESQQAITEAVAGMPAEVQEGIADFIHGMPWEGVMDVVNALAEEDAPISNPEQVCGFLYWAAKEAGSHELHEARETPEEEALEHEGGEYEEMGEGM